MVTLFFVITLWKLQWPCWMFRYNRQQSQLKSSDFYIISCHWFLSILPESVKKPWAFLFFEGVWKETSGIKCVKILWSATLRKLTDFKNSQLAIFQQTDWFLVRGKPIGMLVTVDYNSMKSAFSQKTTKFT